MSLKRPQPSSQDHDEEETPISTSSAIHDRSSKFIALFSQSPAHLSNPKLLQSHSSLEGALHRVLAWRKPSAQTTLTSTPIFTTGSDEDGETYAGKHVEKVLSEAGVKGVCVVGRWFGGVLLGPVRFEHIENCAREAIALGRGDGDGKGERKKVKVDDERVKSLLVKMLGERDESVDVLRGLLAEKTRLVERMKRKKDEAAGEDGKEVEQSSPAKVTALAKPDYEAMDVVKLRTLEKARDATLTWILKQIEQVEGEIERLKTTGEESKIAAGNVEKSSSGLEDGVTAVANTSTDNDADADAGEDAAVNDDDQKGDDILPQGEKT